MTEPFIFANGQKAHNPQDLIQLCQQFPDEGIGYLMREDFEKWLSDINATKMAECARESRQALVANHEKLDLFLEKSQAKPKKELKAEAAKSKPGLLGAIANLFAK